MAKMSDLEQEMFEEVSQTVAEYMMGVTSDVLRDRYEWSNPEIAKFLMYMGLEMLKMKEDENND